MKLRGNRKFVLGLFKRFCDPWKQWFTTPRATFPFLDRSGGGQDVSWDCRYNFACSCSSFSSCFLPSLCYGVPSYFLSPTVTVLLVMSSLPLPYSDCGVCVHVIVPKSCYTVGSAFAWQHAMRSGENLRWWSHSANGNSKSHIHEKLPPSQVDYWWKLQKVGGSGDRTEWEEFILILSG